MDLDNSMFGDSDHIYTSSELIVAVNAYPNRFCTETHHLVSTLVRQVVELPDTFLVTQ